MQGRLSSSHAASAHRVAGRIGGSAAAPPRPAAHNSSGSSSGRQSLLHSHSCGAASSSIAGAASSSIAGATARRCVRAAAATLTAPPPAAAAAATHFANVPRGETAGAVLVAEGITLQAGDRDLLVSADWKMMPGHRVGLVGANGAGKSTLLKALGGLRRVDAGKLVVAHNVAMGYLAQTAVSGSTKTVYDEVRGAMTALVAAEAALEAAGAAAEAGDAAAFQQLADAQEAYEAAGGYDADRRIGVVLDGLGFRREQWDWGCDRFSGGWQMRIALASLLLSPAGQAAAGNGSGDAGGGLLLLDEPTNHLDAAAVKWLAGFLASSACSLVLVSHDEALLQGACDRICEVRGKRLHHYVGSYSKFLEQREERRALAESTAASQAAEIKRLEDFVARFGAKASKASEAQSKLKLLEKLKREAAATTDPSVTAAASASGAGDAKKVALRFPAPPPCHTDVLTVSNLSIGWGSAPAAGDASAAAPVLAGVSFTIRKGQRVLVLGPNGAGKSTLLKAVAGRLQPWAGEVAQGQGVKLAVFDQDLAQELPLDQSPLDYVSEVARRNDPNLPLEKVRAALGALGLTGSLALQTIGSLSGGEKARVALAVFALVPANVLLLDEASNHLDAATLEVLTGALQNFGGAVVAITHNAQFAAALQPTHVLRVAGGKAALQEHSGSLSDRDFDHSPPSSSKGSKAAAAAAPGGGSGKKGKKGKAAAAAAPAAAATNGKVASKGSSSSKPARKRTTLAFHEQQQYEKLCKELERLNAQRAQLEQQVAELGKAAGAGQGFADLEAASLKLAAVAEKAEAVELEWLELAELAGDL